MPSEIEGLIFSCFFAKNRIFGCLGGILEASWVVLPKNLGRLGSQLGSNLDPKMALELPKSGPRGAYRSPKRPLGAKNRPKAAQNLPKPPQGGAHILSKSRFWGILARIQSKKSTIFQSFWRLDFT